MAYHLLEHSLNTAQATELKVHWLDERVQRGNSFGERLTNAIEDVFQLGHENVIVIGADVPGLTAAHLLEAEAALLHTPWVIGPAMDGGTYLIGLQRSAYDRASFLELPWLTDHVGSALQFSLEAQSGNGVVLSTLYDIDQPEDLKLAMSAHQLRGHLRGIWLRLTAHKTTRNPRKHVDHITPRFIQREALRGPPLAA